jgi:hypothetical protein
MWRMRGDLERVPAGGGGEPGPQVALSVRELTRELEELIAALDRRVPRVEEAGEAAIARDAAKLRSAAVRRLAELADHPAASTAKAATPRRPDR